MVGRSSGGVRGDGCEWPDLGRRQCVARGSRSHVSGYSPGPDEVFYIRYGKRAFDIVGATAGLVLLGPVLLLVATAVRLHFGRPALFRQVRPGIGAALFTIYKFRTMRNAADRTGRVLPDAERLTTFGRWLRSTSLDELPELWNVVRGHMSLVGPRPLLPEYL